MVRKLVIATHNAHKAGEMLQILSEGLPAHSVQTLADYPGAPEPEETGSTYLENAAIKARSAAAFTGELCIADDAGLEVDALEGAPGIYSKRLGGEDTDFAHKMEMILDLLRDAENRAARFRCAVAVCEPNREIELFEATCEGSIALRPQGSNGFGYDPIFMLPDGRTMAMLRPEEKHQVSHRGQVLRKVISALSLKQGLGDKE